MKKYALAIFAFIFSLNTFAAQFSTPVGDWKTIDDKTHRVRSIVHIDSDAQGQLYATIEKVFLQKDEKSTDVCDKCRGLQHNKPFVGLTIMTGMQARNGKWGGGRILDPKSGNIYRCQLTLLDNGSKLKVQGFIGIPLLGRTQVWERVG